MMKPTISRRSFLAGCGAAFAAPAILPADVVGVKGGIARRPPPSERIHVGILGYGTMAQDNIGNFLYNERVQVISVCDPVSEGPLYGYRAERMGGREPGRRKVNDFYTEKTGKTYNACKVFSDFREMLDDPELDAVCISTPDHWHALHTIWAAKKGKHIYGQKPLFLTVDEGRAMVAAVKKAGITFQTGAQSRSNDYFRMACELVRNNRIGKLQRVEVGLNKGWSNFGKTAEQQSETPWEKPPAYMDFDMWLGPAPLRKFIPKIHYPMQWRYNLDYSCGMLTDFAAHQLDIMQWALGKDGVEPVAIENIKGEMPPVTAVYNTIGTSFSFDIVYGDGTRVFVSSDIPYGCHFYGENGKTVYVTNGKLETNPPELMREKLREDEIHLIKSGQQEKNFIDAIYTNAENISPIPAGFSSVLPAVLAHIGMRTGQSKLRWDAAKGRFIDNPEADRYLTPHMRGDWTLAI